MGSRYDASAIIVVALAIANVRDFTFLSSGSGVLLEGVLLGGVLLGGALFWYYCQEVIRRRHIETVLRQKTERERLMVQIAHQIRQSLDIDEVLTTTVAEVQRFFQADRVLIYRFEPDGTGRATHETVLPPYPKVLNRTFDQEVFPQQYHQAYALGKVRSIGNINQADVEPCLVDFVKQLEVQAKLVVPIIQNNRSNPKSHTSKHNTANSEPTLWGLLIAHQCSHPRQWQDWEVELMKQLATQVRSPLNNPNFTTSFSSSIPS